MTFTHGNNCFSLGPGADFDDKFSTAKVEEDATVDDDKKNDSSSSSSSSSSSGSSSSNKIKSLINIDGRLHSLLKTPSTKHWKDDHLDRDGAPGYSYLLLIIENRFIKYW